MGKRNFYGAFCFSRLFSFPSLRFLSFRHCEERQRRGNLLLFVALCSLLSALCSFASCGRDVCAVSSGQLLDQERLVIGDDMTTPRLLIGKNSAGNYKVRLSKAGVNAITNEDNTNYIFSSDFNLLRIANDANGVPYTGVATVTIGVGDYQGYVDVPHTLGFKPMVLLAEYSGGSSYQTIGAVLDTFPMYAALTSGGSPTSRFIAPTLVQRVDSYTDKIRITVQRCDAASEVDYLFRYYILYETAETS